jgi:hypothetical protein
MNDSFYECYIGSTTILKWLVVIILTDVFLIFKNSDDGWIQTPDRLNSRLER